MRNRPKRPKCQHPPHAPFPAGGWWIGYVSDEHYCFSCRKHFNTKTGKEIKYNGQGQAEAQANG